MGTSNAGPSEAVRHGGGRRTKNLQKEKKGKKKKERKKEKERKRRDQEGIMYCGVTNTYSLELPTNYRDKHGKGGGRKSREKREEEKNYSGS